MYIPDFKTEEKLLNDGWSFVVGVDEAGRGPLAGPVVAGAVIFKNRNFLLLDKQSNNKEEKKAEYNLIRDSKTLSEKQRERSYDFVKKNFIVGIGICDEQIIDRINILEASFLAMKKAISDLKLQAKKYNFQNNEGDSFKIEDNNCKILVDGNKQLPNFSMAQEAIVQGDKKVKSIAAASIIAKVTRDEIMKKYDEKYPEYKFAQHKGYGTKIHMDALRKYGACEIHRRSFKPVKKVI